MGRYLKLVDGDFELNLIETAEELIADAREGAQAGTCVVDQVLLLALGRAVIEQRTTTNVREAFNIPETA